MVLRIQFTKMRVLDLVVVLLSVFSVVTYAGKIPQRPSRSATANDGDVIRFDLGKLQLIYSCLSSRPMTHIPLSLSSSHICMMLQIDYGAGGKCVCLSACLVPGLY